MRTATLDTELDNDIDNSFDSELWRDYLDVKPAEFLLPGIDLDSVPWSTKAKNISVLTPQDGEVHTKTVDGVGVAYLREYGIGPGDVVTVQISFDPHQRMAYKAIVQLDIDSPWSFWEVSALGENPEQIVDRATRGLYLGDATQMLRGLVARMALVARAQVEDVPAWMAERAAIQAEKEAWRLAEFGYMYR